MICPRASFYAILAASLLLLNGCVIIPISLPTRPDVNEVVWRGGSGFDPDKIAIIEVSGVLTSGGAGDSFFESDSSVVDLARKLAVAKRDSDIKAVILRVDTPGGGVTASDIMYHELKKFRDESGKPVYVSMQTLAASGGYYISMASDRIYASPTTVTGSIGVIATFPELAGVMEKIGVDVNAITSGTNKDAGAFYKEMTEEDRELYQSVVNDMYEKFFTVVSENRTDIPEDRLRELADGRIYTAEQALEAGLVDEIAYLDEVVDLVAETNEIDDPRVVILKRSGDNRTSTVYAQSAPTETAAESAAALTLNLLTVDADSFQVPTSEVFNYLWVP